MNSVVCTNSNSNECGILTKNAITHPFDFYFLEDRESFKNYVQVERLVITDTFGCRNPLVKWKLDDPSVEFIDIYYFLPIWGKLIRISRKLFNAMDYPSLLLTLISNDVGKVKISSIDISSVFDIKAPGVKLLEGCELWP